MYDIENRRRQKIYPSGQVDEYFWDDTHILEDRGNGGSAFTTDEYVWLDNLIYEEELAKRGQGGYTELYYEAFERRVGGLLKARLSRAATDVGSYWYTAWTAAGRPELA